MKVLLFLPLAFIAGEHGFAFFAPYLAVCVVMLCFLKWRRKPVPATIVVPVRTAQRNEDPDLRFAQMPA